MNRRVSLPLFGTLRQLARDPEGKILLVTAAATVAVGTVVYMVLEGWHWIDALYFSVVTLATVGFGDLHPTTAESKLFTVGYILFGVGIIAAFVSEVAKRRTEIRAASSIDRAERAARAARVAEAEWQHETDSPTAGDADEPGPAPDVRSGEP